MACRIDEFNKIYPRVKKDLDKLQEDLKKEIEELKKNLNEQIGQKIYLSVDDLPPQKRKTFDSADEEILANKDIYDAAVGFLKVCREQKEVMRLIYNFNPLFQNSTAFIGLIDLFKYPDSKEYQKIKSYGAKFGIKYRVLSTDMDKVDKLLTGALLINDNNMNSTNDDYAGDKVQVIRKIQAELGPKAFFDNYYDKNIEYLSSVCDKTITKSREAKEKKQNIADEFVAKVKKDIVSKYQKQKEDMARRLTDIENLVDCGNEYNEKGDQESLEKFLKALLKLELITPREYKLLSYEEKEDTEEEEIATEEVQVEEVKEDKEPRKLEDALYFADKNTQTIICFLGKEDRNEILEDLYEYLDKPQREDASAELIRLFNGLYNDKDFITEVGKKPASTYENRKATVLLDAPYNFEYKRLGKSRDDKYRIHAISRTSECLKKLGYGSGNIIFFGSVGVNKDDKSKTEAYQRLGKRAVASISDMSGESSILMPSFDYIEHITRGYVPLDLLSKEDKEKSNDGRFIGRYRENNKSRSIEGGNYVLFDVLSEESQDNVKKYLSNYFLNQSNKMFEIINDYEKNKDKSYE